MDIIDGDGFLFGVVNIIDALVILLVAAVLIAGTALVAPAGGETQQTKTVVIQTGAQPNYVIDAVEEGQVATSDIVAVNQKTVTQINDNKQRLRLTVRLEVEENRDGLPTFRGDRLYVGRELTLDLGETIVKGTVVDMQL